MKRLRFTELIRSLDDSGPRADGLTLLSLRAEEAIRDISEFWFPSRLCRPPVAKPFHMLFLSIDQKGLSVCRLLASMCTREGAQAAVVACLQRALGARVCYGPGAGKEWPPLAWALGPEKEPKTGPSAFLAKWLEGLAVGMLLIEGTAGLTDVCVAARHTALNPAPSWGFLL